MGQIQTSSPVRKADKVKNSTNGNFAALDGNGNLVDSGHKHSDYLTSHQDITEKADKVTSATNGNFAALDSNGNLTDSGHKHSDYITDVSEKADKVSSATNGNFAALDSNGNLTDSGHKHSDYITNVSDKADKVNNATSGNIAALDGNGNLTDSGKTLGKSVPSDAVFTDTTYSTFTGAGASTAGTSGLVPAPSSGGNLKFLRGDGTWANAPTPSVSDIADIVYPVGSIYMSVASTSPATLFGGTWEQLKDRFLLGAGDTYTAGNTGGASSRSYTPDGTVGYHTLTTSEIPSHSHSLNSHTHSVGAHSHGLNSHTHGSGSYSASSGGSHDHCGYLTTGLCASGSGGVCAINSVNHTISTSDAVTQSGGSHSHSVSGTSGSASGSTANSSSFDSGSSSGSTGTKGSGDSHNHSFSGTSSTINTMPPYLVVYMWKRTA